MKKIISVFLCICLMSGCGKPLSHGRPANDVVEYTGSEATPPLPSNTPVPEPSNTPAPTPEPSKSVLPSDSADTGSSVGKYVFYAVLCVVALAVIVVDYDLFRYFSPIEVITPAPNPVDVISPVAWQSDCSAYKFCYRYYENVGISYTWHFGILLAKKEILKRCFWIGEQDKEIDSKITVYEFQTRDVNLGMYVYKL